MMPRTSAKQDKGKAREPLSAEILSFTTERPISDFPSNVRITNLDPSTVITTRKQISDNPRPQRGYGVTPTPKGSAQKTKAKPSSKSVEDAIRSIGGSLALLNEKERGAVLTRINGAYGFKTQVKQATKAVEKTVKKGKPKKDIVPPPTKNAFNAAFDGTITGVLLNETSKRLKELSQSTTKKVSPSLHAVHSTLLKDRNAVKMQFVKDGEQKAKLPIPEDTPEHPSVTIDALIQSVDILNQVIKDNPLQSAVSPADIVSAGTCLLQGTQHPLLTQLTGKIPDKDAWGEASSDVPRTAEEEKKRAAQLVDLKEHRKESKKRKHDSEAAAKSSASGRKSPPKTRSQDDPEKKAEDVVMDSA